MCGNTESQVNTQTARGYPKTENVCVFLCVCTRKCARADSDGSAGSLPKHPSQELGTSPTWEAGSQ